MEAVVRALARYGGMLAAPRRTLAALPAVEGRHDGILLSIAFVAAAGVWAIVEALAGVVALRDSGAALMLGAAVARVLIAPVLILVAAEVVLGDGRRHRRAYALVPAIAVVAVLHEAALQGLDVPSPVPEVLAGLVGVAATWLVRGSVPIVEEAAQ